MNNENEFVIFILTHGRAHNVRTYTTLRRQGYTGPIKIVIDNEDKTAEEYYKKFGDDVVMFDKEAISKTFDEADNFDDRRAIIYARNACFDIARDLGYTYFMEFDDDYTTFTYRIGADMQHPRKGYCVKNKLDDIFSSLLEYYKNTPFKSIATSQGGDWFDGAHGFGKAPKRKCMNSFICSIERPFQFVGRINEDVNTYTWFQSQGNAFITIPFIQLDQITTQSNEGGMTDIYIDKGTYIKSFYTILFQPSSVTIEMMGTAHRRLHHRINWDHTTPMILRENVRKLQEVKNE